MLNFMLNGARFSIIPDPGKYWEIDFEYDILSWKFWKSDSSWCPGILEILEIGIEYAFVMLEILPKPKPISLHGLGPGISE